MSTLDLDSILDSSIDDLVDLPEFSIYPAGVHSVIIEFETKEVNKHPCVELVMKAVETIELANPAQDAPLEAGAEGTVLFMLDNEFGQGKFKALIKQIAEATGTSTIKEAVEAAKGMEVQVVTKIRQNKDKTQSYTDVVKFLI